MSHEFKRKINPDPNAFEHILRAMEVESMLIPEKPTENPLSQPTPIAEVIMEKSVSIDATKAKQTGILSFLKSMFVRHLLKQSPINYHEC